MKKSLLVSVAGVLAATPVIIWAQCASMAGVKDGGSKAGCGTACVSKSAGCLHAASEKKAEITTAGLKALLDAKTPVVLLDARSGKFDDGKRIPGAASLNDQSSAEQVTAVVPDKSALVVTYCSNLKCPASGRLAAYLRGLGYSNVIEYPAGIQGWTDSGHAVDSVATN